MLLPRDEKTFHFGSSADTSGQAGCRLSVLMVTRTDLSVKLGIILEHISMYWIEAEKYCSFCIQCQ